MSEQLKKNILKDLTILYIEDENNIRVNITKTLELIVKKVIACENAEDALNEFESNNIDIIISDINLPSMSGLELSQKIRTLDSDIPIILLTAHLDTSYLLEATRLKLIDYLIKPVDFEALNTVLQKAANEVISNARYEVTFENNARYNIQQKCLYDENEDTISLTASEIELLEYMIQHQSRLVSTEEIKSIVWEDPYDATDSALKNLLNKVRKKVGKEAIVNISGVGYRLTIKS